MRLFKGFLIVLTGLFLCITLLSLFIPSRLVVTRAVVINADATTVFNEINDLQKWKHWQPVFIRDSAIINFTGHVNRSASTGEWISNGKKNIMHIVDTSNRTVKVVLSRAGENDIYNTIRILPVSGSNAVQAEWTVLVKLKWYPWEKFYGIFIEKISGQGYEDALNGLKNYVESN